MAAAQSRALRRHTSWHTSCTCGQEAQAREFSATELAQHDCASATSQFCKVAACMVLQAAAGGWCGALEESLHGCGMQPPLVTQWQAELFSCTSRKLRRTACPVPPAPQQARNTSAGA